MTIPTDTENGGNALECRENSTKPLMEFADFVIKNPGMEREMYGGKCLEIIDRVGSDPFAIAEAEMMRVVSDPLPGDEPIILFDAARLYALGRLPRAALTTVNEVLAGGEGVVHPDNLKFTCEVISSFYGVEIDEESGKISC